ncbi:MAG: hypothetical protein M3209_09660 [Acidobacteriota bacterium]|nr:hypothetical protein [Acidobacteriota bacterium]
MKINELTKTLLVRQAQTLLWRLNRNRSNAKRKKKISSTDLAKYDRLIAKANRRYERRVNLPVELPLVLPGQGRIYRMKK